jgi:hypothetical protein
MTSRRLYEPIGPLVLRTPLFPIRDYLDWSAELRAPQLLRSGADADLEAAVVADRRRLRLELRAFFARPAADEAIFLASPSFRVALARLDADAETKANRDLGVAALRYLTRLTTRSTPFGTCAGTSFGRIGPHTRLELSAPERYQRAIRLDGGYVYGLARAIEARPACRPFVRYRPNDTLYVRGRSLRYVETIGAPNASSPPRHHLVDLQRSEALLRVLEWSADGETPGVLVAGLQRAFGADADEAEGYVRELIDRGVLVGDVAPPPVGEEPLRALRRRLDTIPAAAPVADILDELQRDLDELAERRLGQHVDAYEQIATKAARLHPAGSNSVLHVDLYKPAPALALHDRVIDDVLAAVEVLATFGATNDPLVDFRARFLARYGEQERPLGEVLDEESGVGFHAAPPLQTPLLAGLGLGLSEPATSDSVPPHMVAWLHDVWTSGRIEHELGPELARAMKRGDTSELPPQLCALIRVEARDDAAVDAGDYRLLLTGVSCAPASKFLGRFAHGSDDALRLAQASVELEDERNSPYLTAEIVHLSAPEAANVTCRPQLRTTQIPIASRAAVQAEQIPLGDLAVRVVDDEVVLRSVARDQRVIPAMASAADPRRSPVSAYAFLDAVGRAAYHRALNWSWPAALERARFLPRVRIGRVVLTRARWRLEDTDMGSDLEAAPYRQLAQLHDLGRRFGIPRHVVLRQGDRELLLDLHNTLCVDVVVKTLRRDACIVLLEAFGLEDTPVQDGLERYAHDLIVPRPRRPCPSPTETSSARSLA